VSSVLFFVKLESLATYVIEGFSKCIMLYSHECEVSASIGFPAVQSQCFMSPSKSDDNILYYKIFAYISLFIDGQPR